MMTMRVVTDGACSQGAGNATWQGGYGTAWVGIDEDGQEIEGRYMVEAGGEDDTTNNRMELQAAIRGLEQVIGIKTPMNIELYSDSNYVIQGLKSWCAGWVKRGWKKADKKPVENVELWKKLWAAYHHFYPSIKVYWNRGHVKDNQIEKAYEEFLTKNKLDTTIVSLDQYKVINGWNGIVDKLATRYQNGIRDNSNLVGYVKELRDKAITQSQETPMSAVEIHLEQQRKDVIQKALFNEGTQIGLMTKHTLVGIVQNPLPQEMKGEALRRLDKDIELLIEKIKKFQKNIHTYL